MALLWTAPGDDADAGRAYRYDLRFSTASVGADTAGWWGGATAAANLPRPSVSGSTDSTIVTGLNPETVYYFVIQSSDEAGNVSGFSNVATAATDPEIPPPALNCSAPGAAPARFSATQDSGGVALAWAPASDPLAGALHVWRAPGNSGPLALIATITDPLRTTYLDTNVRAGRTYRYRATWSATCGDGPATPSEVVSIPDGGSPGAPVTASTALPRIHAFPNPSTDAVRFVVHIADPSGERVQIRLFDLSGKVIADIADGSFPSGDTIVSWPRLTRNGARVAPGYYESIGTIGNASVRERLVLLP